MSEELGFWLSSLATSYREVKGALGQLALGRVGPDLKNDITLLKDALDAGDVKTEADMRTRIQQTLQQQQESELEREKEMKTWERLLKSGFFKGIFMAMPAVLFGSFTFLTLKSLSNFGKGTISLAPEKFSRFKAKINVFKKGKSSQVSGEDSQFSQGEVQNHLKKPSDVDLLQEDINNIFNDQQESEIEAPPLVDILNVINNNPKDVMTKEQLANKFNEVRLADWICKLTQDERFAEYKETFEKIKQNSKDIEFQNTKESITEIIIGALHDVKDQRYVDINGIVMYDPNFVLVGLPHYNPEQNLVIPFNQPIKDFVKDLKRTYYSVSYKVKLALLKGGRFIEINEESDEHLTRWLIRNGYSLDETIYILPVDKDYKGPLYEEKYWVAGMGNPSPYAIHFEEFRIELRDLVFVSGLTSVNSYPATSKFLLPNNEKYLIVTYSQMNLGNHFNILETTLLTMHARVLNKLENQHRVGQLTKTEFARYVDEFNKLFNEQYSIYGFVSDNPFYFEGRLNAHKIGDLLMDYGFIEKNELTGDLYRFIQPFGASEKSLTMFSYKTEDYKYSIPSEATYINLKLSLEIAILDFADRNAVITEETAKKAIEEVNSLMNNFIQLIRDAKEARKIFESYSRKHAKVDLLMQIHFCHPALRQIGSLDKFSKLIFGDKNYLQDNFLRNDILEHRPEPYRLHGIVYNTRKWTTDDFDNLITQLELEELKDKVEIVVYNWIFSNPSQYIQPYITETPRRFGRLQSRSFLTLEYELMQALTHAVSAFHDKVFIAFGEVRDKLGIPTQAIEKLLSPGEQSATVRDLLRAKSTIVSYILDGSITEKKLQFYDRALEKIDEYLATRHLRLLEEKVVSRQGYDEKLWQDDKIMAYHVITLLCRDLGFDPLTFQPLNPQIFDANPSTGLFARHHLDILRKYSVYLQDLLLTDNTKHREYDSNIPLRDQKVLVQIIQDLILNDGSGSNNEITANDVVKTFLNNFGDPVKAKFYLENYWQSGDFQQNLEAFNKRKNLIKNGDYESFIQTKYSDAYTRFFSDAMNILNSLTELADYKGYKLSRVFSITDIYYLRRVFGI